MGFGKIFGKSWEEYKSNFKPLFKIMLLFYAIPMIILLIFSTWWFISSGLADTLVTTSKSFNITDMSVGNYSFPDTTLFSNSARSSLSPSYFIIYGLLFLVILLINFFACFSISAVSLRKEKFTFKEAIGSIDRRYWKSVGFMAVLTIFLSLLFLALLIPGIIFAVFWIFGYFIFLDEKKGIIFSLKRSFHFVRKKWWKTFGYILLIILVNIVISIIFGIPAGIFQIYTFFALLSGKLSIPILLWGSFIKQVFTIAGAFVSLPLTILFFKNFYLARKKERV